MVLTLKGYLFYVLTMQKTNAKHNRKKNHEKINRDLVIHFCVEKVCYQENILFLECRQFYVLKLCKPSFNYIPFLFFIKSINNKKKYL